MLRQALGDVTNCTPQRCNDQVLRFLQTRKIPTQDQEAELRKLLAAQKRQTATTLHVFDRRQATEDPAADPTESKVEMGVNMSEDLLPSKCCDPDLSMISPRLSIEPDSESSCFSDESGNSQRAASFRSDNSDSSLYEVVSGTGKAAAGANNLNSDNSASPLGKAAAGANNLNSDNSGSPLGKAVATPANSISDSSGSPLGEAKAGTTNSNSDNSGNSQRAASFCSDDSGSSLYEVAADTTTLNSDNSGTPLGKAAAGANNLNSDNSGALPLLERTFYAWARRAETRAGAYPNGIIFPSLPLSRTYSHEQQPLRCISAGLPPLTLLPHSRSFCQPANGTLWGRSVLLMVST
jgi:hypothetical protein